MKKRIFIYGIGTFFSKVLVFLMVPIYTRVFLTSDYGYYDVLVSNMQMIVSIAFIEIWSGIIRFMFEDQDKYGPIKTMLRMMPILIVFYSIGVFILSFIFEIKYPYLTIIYGITYLLFSVNNSICRGLEQNIKYVISGVISTFISCALSIIFAVVLHLGIQYLLVANSIGYFLSVVYVEFTTKAYRKAIHSNYKQGSIKEMSRYCFPLMMNSFSYLFLGTFNKNMIIRNLGEGFSGICAYVTKFSAVVAVLLSVYALAWQEQAFISADADDNEEQYSHYLNEFIKFMGLGIPVYVMACIIISPLFGGSNYYYSEKYIPLEILGSFMAAFSGVISTVIAVNKKTSFILLSTAIGAGVNVILSSVFISRYGINASQLSLCIGFLVITLLRYYFAKRDFDLNIYWRYFALMLVEIIVIFTMILLLGSKQVVNAVALIFMLLIWIFINKESIRNIFILIKKKVMG